MIDVETALDTVDRMPDNNRGQLSSETPSNLAFPWERISGRMTASVLLCGNTMEQYSWHTVRNTSSPSKYPARSARDHMLLCFATEIASVR